jgi:hypothetical protein
MRARTLETAEDDAALCAAHTIRLPDGKRARTVPSRLLAWTAATATTVRGRRERYSFP